MEVRAVKVRSYAPALLAVGLLAGLYLYITRHHEEPEQPVATAEPAHAEPAPAASPAPSLPVVHDDSTAPKPMPEATDGPTKPPHALTPEEYAGHEPKAKKPKMNVDEKLAETTKHISVMEHRATLIDAQVAELEKAGKTKEAAEQRIIADRLRKHAEQLRADVAAHRDPTADTIGDDSLKAKDEQPQ
jgi:hypothetical protein